MPRFSPPVALPLFLFLPSLLAEGPAPFVHLQPDRTSYRLGETVWFRAHSREGEPVEVRLIGPSGKEGARTVVTGSEPEPFCGKLLIPAGAEGGPFRLQAF